MHWQRYGFVEMLKELWDLLFPRHCCGCRVVLSPEERILCTKCRIELPLISPGDLDKGIKEKISIPLQMLESLLYFEKGNITQRLIHELKYHQQFEIGTMLGESLGHRLKKYRPTSRAELIVPVPSHPKRLRKRGYNQVMPFAEGLSKILQIPIDPEVLIRVDHGNSQTTKNRDERFNSIKDAFQCQKALNKIHVLLVDDVLTTGATLEHCCKALLNRGAEKLSVATMAYAT